MNFLNLHYLPWVLLSFGLFLIVLTYFERRFFTLVQKYWFFKRSLFSYFSSFFFLMGMGLLLLALLDVRGPEERIKTPIPKERTLILIDTSASMLAEDVRPSRLQKAAMIAKHFARKAAGHQIAVVAFSEISKKIVPFTTDLDLIDARLDSIKNMRNQYASSAVTASIQESIQYLKEGSEDAGGNILVLTDGEETAPELDLRVPENVRVALVGIGTTQGGRIPLDDGRGLRFGYKKDRGVDVITKLNENFFRQVVERIPSGKYWLANTYSLPSEEIVDYFKGEFQKGLDEQDMVIRPVMMQWFVVPAILALILSYAFKAVRIFALGIILCLSFQVQAAEEISEDLAHRLQQLSQGDLNKMERLKLADDLYKAGSKKEALKLFEENLRSASLDNDVPPEAYLNYGTALLENDQIEKALQTYQDLAQASEGTTRADELREIMQKNVLAHFQMKQEQEKQQKKNKDKNKDQDQNKSGQGGGEDQQPQSGKNQPQQEGNSGEQQKPEDSQDGDEKKDNDPQKGDEDKKNDEGEDQNDQSEGAQEPQESQIRARKKVDPKLQQLMDDDRQLQLKMMEGGTRDLNKRKSPKSKDW